MLLLAQPPGDSRAFDSWLREEGIYEKTMTATIKRVLARELEAIMKEQKVSKAEMAKRMHTSRASLNRLLDPENDVVTLNALLSRRGNRPYCAV